MDNTGTGRGLLSCVLAALVIGGCSNVTPARESGAETRAPQRSRTLVAVVGGMESELNRILLGGVNPNRARRTLFASGLVRIDPQGNALPHLAEAVPELNTDSWRLLPDGRMETTYRLHPNLTWHDGAPLTPDDFVFAWQVYTSPGLGISTVPPQGLMEEVAAVEARTFVIRWLRPFPQAGRLQLDDFPAIPRHLLGGPFREAEPRAFANHPYWTSAFVGAGPFKLARWEPGAFEEGVAFDGYVLGRPKIDAIKLLTISDQNTVFANVLAGEVQLAADTMEFAQAMVLKGEWDARKGGTIWLVPDTNRHVQIQVRRELATPRALLDVRVRRALAHTVDKQALNDGLYDGQGVIADAMVRPWLPSYAQINRAIMKYAYDPRTAEQLLSQVGFVKGPDGFFAHPSEGKLQPEVRVRPGTRQAQELSIMTDGWRRVGVDATPRILSAGEFADAEFKSTFGGLFTTGTSSDEDSVQILRTAAIPRPENRWTGLNLAGWSNPEFDRLFDSYTATLDRPGRDQLLSQMLRLVSEEVPVIPLNFTLSVSAAASELIGPERPRDKDETMWNVHLWKFR